MPSLLDFLRPLEERLDRLESRVSGIEEKLDRILARLSSQGDEIGSQASDESLDFVPLPFRDGVYEYRSLNESANEIRIIVLYSATSDEDPIECELLHASLDLERSNLPRAHSTAATAIEQFKTLSYTWGELEKSAFIYVDGYRFPVTKNLEAALRCLRSLNKPVSKTSPAWSFWWIDALCINQVDLLERNCQVDLMTQIYRKAAGMHVWLGEQADGSDIAMQLAKDIGDTSPRGPGVKSIDRETTDSPGKTQNWQSLIALFQRPWWQRVWVRQEVALAKNATVHCGSAQCSFEALTITLDILVKIVEQLGYNPPQPENASKDGRPALARALALTNFRSAMGQRPNIEYRSLAQLIPHTRSCQATDPRDKVFSLLGLVDPSSWQIQTDYRLSMAETFTNAAKNIITRTQSLDILSACQNPNRLNDLPSWVPNLAATWKTRPMPPQMHWGEVVVGEAQHFAVEGDVLRAQGGMIDVIDRLCDVTVEENATEADLDAISKTWKDFASLALENKNMHVLDRGHIMRYNDDSKWIVFLSIGTDRRQLLRQSQDPIKTPGNYRLAETLLLLNDEGSSAITVDAYRTRVHEHLRKTGVGRKICLTEMGEKRGTAALVPAEAEKGDEIWLFRGTSFPYVLRKVGENYVVIGEAFSDRYYFPFLKKYTPMDDRKLISII